MSVTYKWWFTTSTSIIMILAIVVLVVIILTPCKTDTSLEFLYSKDNEDKEREAVAQDRKYLEEIIRNEISRNDSSGQEEDEETGAALQKLVGSSAIFPSAISTKSVSPKWKIIHPIKKVNQPETNTEASSAEQSEEQEGQNKTKKPPSKVSAQNGQQQ